MSGQWCWEAPKEFCRDLPESVLESASIVSEPATKYHEGHANQEADHSQRNGQANAALRKPQKYWEYIQITCIA